MTVTLNLAHSLASIHTLRDQVESIKLQFVASNDPQELRELLNDLTTRFSEYCDALIEATRTMQKAVEARGPVDDLVWVPRELLDIVRQSTEQSAAIVAEIGDDGLATAAKDCFARLAQLVDRLAKSARPASVEIVSVD